MEYSFRSCTLEDFDFLFNLKKENFKWYVDKMWGWKDEEQKERLKQDLNEHLLHKRIIVINNELAGVYAVHLHDNDKSDDLHLLPFDGTIDWKYVMNKLKECNYNGYITMELCYRYNYLDTSLDDFYKIGYKRGIELSKIVN